MFVAAFQKVVRFIYSGDKSVVSAEKELAMLFEMFRLADQVRPLLVVFIIFIYKFWGGFYCTLFSTAICRPSDSTVPMDAGIEPRTVATGALAVRCSNH
jgi:hypothetical protein